MIGKQKGQLNCKDEGYIPSDNHWTRTIRWRHYEDGKFSVNKVCERNQFEMAESLKGPWKATWKSMAPTKVNFAWLVAKKACLTHEAHQKKKLQIAFPWRWSAYP